MARFKKQFLVLAVIFCISMVFAACGSDDGGGSETEKPKEETTCEVTYSSAEIYTDSIDTSYVRVIGIVENTGTTDLYLETATADIEDENGEIIDSIDMVSVYPNVIAPGEKAYYYEEGFLEADPGKCKAVLNFDYDKAVDPIVRYDVSEDKIKEEYESSYIVGRTANNTEEDAEFVYVAVIAFDKDGNVLGVGFDIIDTLKAGKEHGFKAYIDEIAKDDIDHYEVFAYKDAIQF